MTDRIALPTALTTTLTIVTDWPLSKPNRDLNGDQKAAVIHGVRRHVISSGNRKAHWRRTRVPGSLRWLAERDPHLAGTYTLSTRTKHVADKLIALPLLEDDAVRQKLAELGIGEAERRARLVELGSLVFSILQKSKKPAGGDTEREEDGKAKETEEAGPEASDLDDEQPEADDSQAPEAKGRDTAIAAYGQREMALIRDAVKERLLQARTWDEMLGKGPSKAKKGKQAGVDLATLLREGEKLQQLWLLSRVERLGIDGALFGTMVTQRYYRIAAPSAVQVSHSITAHRAFDFETLEIARDDLEDGKQAAILLDASYASGLYVTSVTIDHAQLLENVMAPRLDPSRGKPWADQIVWRPWTDATEEERQLASRLARAVVISILYASDHAMKTQTNARVIPSYVLAETSAKGGLNLQGAISRPVHERSNNMLFDTIERLRAYSRSFDEAYGMVEERAEFIPNPLVHDEEDGGTLGRTDAGWNAMRVLTADALADWVADKVWPAAAAPAGA